ncbi:GntR family transcriptional regulator [Sphingomonas sp. PP-CE-3G-477]|uniref:GntR family transcriptional regulator n=1 Tax=Sphingomonas sp. PP-CE-3G-477 TaxID=2135660 RepID=UPI000D360215|nr:GntR family transcriptional regulator [Sphingomonas sp. PP-CE-3G-477]PTQ62862.1 GntR family transcriptional regulator [Sphingomonas sp. PP-CE-3G-477]
MNSGPTVERVHDILRARILSREFRPGDRLDPAVLAAPLSASVTPVRDALHLLTGEGLVETRTSGGFHVPALDEPGLKDLYDWAAELLVLAIRSWPKIAFAKPVGREIEHRPIADRVGDIFREIVRQSSNREHVLAIGRLNARLHAVRTVEPLVLEHTDEELAAIEAAATGGERDALRRLVTAYHRRRRRLAAEIVRTVYRSE